MRKYVRVITYIALSVRIGAGSGYAQNPSTDQIVRSLANPPPSGDLRGIRLRPTVNFTVEFETDSAKLTPQATRTLDELGRALTSSALSGYRFRIEGHTDTVGTREYNRALSERRAASVLDYLVARWRIDPSKLEAVGMGEDQLLVPTGPNVSEVRNRRVAVVNLSM